MKKYIFYLFRICIILVLLLSSLPLKNSGLTSEVKARSLPSPNNQESDFKIFLPLIANKFDLRPVLTIWSEPYLQTILQQISVSFEATHNVHVIVEAKNNLRDEFSAAAPAGTGPDIAYFPHDHIARLVATGLLDSIDIGPKAVDFLPSSLDAIKYGNEYFGLPFAVENLAFIYNKDLVTTPPTSWDALHTLGQSLQTSNSVDWGFMLPGTTYDAYPLMTALGGYVFGKNSDSTWNTDDLGIGSSGMIAFGELAKTWADEGFLSTNIEWENAHTGFETGKVPWIMAGPWALGRIRESGVNYGISKFPSGVPFSGVQAFVINSFSHQKLLANKFLTEYVATTGAMLQLYESTYRTPAYLPAQSLIDDPDLIAFGQAGLSAEVMPAIPEMGCVWGPWDAALRSILNGSATPTAAYTLAASAIRSCIDYPRTGMVNVPGSFQSEVGCDADWDPACNNTALVQGEDGLYRGTFAIPTGSWECKVALDGSWTTSYGVGGSPAGGNIPFTTTALTDVTFVYHPDTHILDIIIL